MSGCLSLLFLLLLSSCHGGKANHGEGQKKGKAVVEMSGDSGATGASMAMDHSLCKEPTRMGLLMQSDELQTDNLPPHSASVNETAMAGQDTGQMVLIKGGRYKMGTEEFPDARPVHTVEVSSFYMDIHEVTNDQFARFVSATHYVTVAERPLDPKDFPGVPADKLGPGSGVFTPPPHPVSLDNPLAWWRYVPGADWRHPKGPGSSIEGKGDYPVVQVCYEDCLAYAKWAGKRLPTEAEWEYAARAGQQYKDYYWGKELHPDGKYMANNFQGHFPDYNTLEDGYADLAPIGRYPVNGYGLYDMEGNAWEWCSDFYRPDYYSQSPLKNPQGPKDSYDPHEPGLVKRVQRGGSFLCSDEYCIRYKAGSRGNGEPGSASNNLGFRLVRSE